ncbi:catalase family peroxidase [Rheinheimera metallidurans]|uniref:catalase family peroxidase n=1 Tax=Rheinheimera metallidurans TaxID=2925781 RepID=UPI00300212E9
MSTSPNKKISINRRYSLIFVVIAVLVFSFLYAAGLFGNKDVTAQDFVNLQQSAKPYFGFRRAHAKGVCLQGEFIANGALAPFSQSSLFQTGSNTFTGRFSIAGNNPLAPDLAAPVRSFALSFATADGERWRTGMNTPPVVAVRTPEAFFEQLTALSPDPATGKPDPSKIKAFFQAHPESATFNHWKQQYQATSSFATEQYHSINAFYLIDAKGQRRAARWAAVPQATDKQPENAIANAGPDALQLELAARLAQQPVKFDLMFTLANQTDDENDPTVLWPDDREQVNAGTLVITQWQAQQDGACNGITFDPLVLPKGIEATKDPILNARGAAYAESYRRRAKETLLQQTNQPQQGAH